MTNVFTLLSLPTSNAFTAFRSSKLPAEAGSRSPPRKTPRLSGDSDSASASRTRAADEQKGPIAIQVLGPPITPRPERAFDAEYNVVKRCIRLLLTKGNNEPLPDTYQKIYTSCQAVVCIARKGEGLYDNLRLDVERCVSTLAGELIHESRLGVEWLIPFIELCTWFEKQVALLESLLAYLDRVYVAERKDLQHIRALAYNQLGQQVFASADIAQRLREGIKTWVDWERANRTEHPLRPYIPALISRLQHHGKYKDMFELHYITFTYNFYETESAEVSKSATARDFLKHCEDRRTEEINRSREVLAESSWVAVIDATDRAMLSGRLEWLAKEALPQLMDAAAEDKLAKTYMLFDRVQGVKVLLEVFKIYVQAKVKAIVTDAENDENMVERLLRLKALGDRLVESAFIDQSRAILSAGTATATPSKPSTSSLRTPTAPAPAKQPNKDFSYALSDAFQKGFKARRNKPAEMIAKYLDRAMRKGQKGKKDEEFQAELDAALGLYRFTDDKDVFRTFYHRALAKRLLLERSASDDFEKAMLKRLKEHYDPEFGMGDHMFNDLALSRDIMREYLEQRARAGEDVSNHKLSVMVLQRSFWPFATRKHDVDLPPSMQDELNKHAVFYKLKHQGHKLDWDHALGTATLKARFNAGDKDLTVSLYQAVVLLLFNEELQISFADIKAQTRMEQDELQRTLQSLACGKKRVLRKQPPGKDVHDDDVFHFNADFTDPAYRVHINSIQAKETPEESKRTQTLIEADRKHALDAAIVRVMKARKELHYEQLKAATIEAVKTHFVPEVSVIKQRISSLVEQEYLRRSEDDMNLYIYVA